MSELIQKLLSESSVTTSPLVATLRQKEAAQEAALEAARTAEVAHVDEIHAHTAQDFLNEVFGIHSSQYRLGTGTGALRRTTSGSGLDRQDHWYFPVYRGGDTQTRVAIRISEGWPGDWVHVSFATYRLLFNHGLSPARAARRLQR